MRISIQNVLTELALRFNEVLPPPFSVAVQGGHISLLDGGKPCCLVPVPGNGWPGASEEEFVRRVMDCFQTDVAHFLAIPWPSGDGVTMANASTAVVDNELRMWFGESEQSAVIAWRPIALTPTT